MSGHPDVLIIGAGAAGLFCALGLKDSASVTVVEAGPDPGTPPPRWMLYDYLLPEDCYYHYTDADTGLDLPQGRGTGGGSTVNSAAALRGQPWDYDGWAVPGWSWRDCLDGFRAIESDQQFGHAEYHGAAGPIPITRLTPGPLDEALTALCAQRGERLVEWPGGEPGDGDGPRGAVIFRVAELLVGLDGAEAVQAVPPGPAGHGPAVVVPRLAAQGRGRVDRGPAAGAAPLGQIQAGVRVGVVVVAVLRQQVVVEHPARRRRARVRPGLDHRDRRRVLQAERAEQAGRTGPDDEDIRVAAHGRMATDCGSRLASWSAMTERMCWRIRVSARCPSRWTMAS